MEVIHQEFEVNKILGVTTPDNSKAIRLVEKLGFVCVAKDENEVTYEFVLSQ
ncbi:hypothetical protein [Myroides odoratus]|uniref:hypothetical protein n=1 Tax=Myroides odoratus TaxID=256 RepID=UPI0015F0DA45|nr:hypothetical protein [Myroides odoratus]QQU04776.1 hypothetical protein I6I89_05660 [Myroides odoratus]